MAEQVQFIGVTIGPIYKTLARLRSTRAIFSGSYLFSFLMREMLRYLDGQSGDQQGKIKGKVLLPALGALGDQHPGAGLYPDRMILAAETGDFERVKNARIHALRSIAAGIQKDSGLPEPVILEYLEGYLQVYCLELKLPLAGRTIDTVNQCLDSLELQPSFHPQDSDLLYHYLIKKEGSFILRDAFKARKSFDSLIEIASRELKFVSAKQYETIIEQSENDKTFDPYEAFADRDQFKGYERLREYHHYIAVVQADGDWLGKLIGQTPIDELPAISTKLLEFGKAACKIITDHGGAPVYIGGDDLLFFSPVATTLESGDFSTVFTLVALLDAAFHEQFPKGKDQPTLSFGISMTYYKYPLNEALEISRKLLAEAKDEKKFPRKNTVVFKAQSHSGSFFQAGFDKNSQTWKDFLKLQKPVSGNTVLPSLPFSSLIYFLTNQRAYLNRLLQQGNAERIKNFFDNSFDENVHDSRRSDVQSISKFLLEVYLQNPASVAAGIGEQPVDIAYTALRFLKMLQTNDYAIQNVSTHADAA